MPGNPQCVDNLVGEKTAQGKRLHDTGTREIFGLFSGGQKFYRFEKYRFNIFLWLCFLETTRLPIVLYDKGKNSSPSRQAKLLLNATWKYLDFKEAYLIIH